MATLFATLDLEAPVKTVSGTEANKVNVYRITFGAFAPVIEKDDTGSRIRLFADAACKGVVNGGGSEEKIRADTLTMADAYEIGDAMLQMRASEDLEFDGDGISHPLVYTLTHPLQIDKDTMLSQIEFSSKTLGAVANFLNANGEGDSFREFMRNFGTLVGVNLPITDAIVNALDIEDYSNIVANIVGKLARPRGRLKRVS